MCYRILITHFFKKTTAGLLTQSPAVICVILGGAMLEIITTFRILYNNIDAI